MIDDELDDLAHGACQEALSFGVGVDVFRRLALEVRRRCGMEDSVYKARTYDLLSLAHSALEHYRRQTRPIHYCTKATGMIGDYLVSPQDPSVSVQAAQQESRMLFVARVEALDGVQMTGPEVLALLNDCDMLASRMLDRDEE